MADSEHNVTININGDANVAVNALNKVKSGLSGVGRAISMVSGALGKINWAINGIQMLIQGVTWLKDKITETSRELGKMSWDFAMRTAASETERLVKWHEKLIKMLKDEFETKSKLREIESIEQQGKKDFDDGKREADRARQIFEAKTPEEEQALKDRFASEDEQRALKEKKAARKQLIKQIKDEVDEYIWLMESLRKNNNDIDKQIEAEKWNVVLTNGNEELAKPIKERIQQLEKQKDENNSRIEQANEERAIRQVKIQTLEGVKEYEGPSAGEWQRKTEAKKRAEEAAKKESEAKAEADRKAAEESSRAAKKQQDEENRKKTEQANSLEAFADRAAAADGVSQNRLTAMGLGSGVSANGGVASDVRKLVDLLRQNVKATESINKNGDAEDVAVYGE